MSNEVTTILKELTVMAQRWREDRERFLVKGGDNSLEVNEFEAELDEHFNLFLFRQWQLGIISKEQYVETWSAVHNEWVILVSKAREMTRLSKMKWWIFYG